MRIAYRVLFWLVFLPLLVFMMAAAIVDELACGLDAALDFLENKGWPE